MQIFVRVLSYQKLQYDTSNKQVPKPFKEPQMSVSLHIVGIQRGPCSCESILAISGADGP